jgi:hypothetical protein
MSEAVSGVVIAVETVTIQEEDEHVDTDKHIIHKCGSVEAVTAQAVSNRTALKGTMRAFEDIIRKCGGVYKVPLSVFQEQGPLYQEVRIYVDRGMLVFLGVNHDRGNEEAQRVQSGASAEEVRGNRPHTQPLNQSDLGEQ